MQRPRFLFRMLGVVVALLMSSVLLIWSGSFTEMTPAGKSISLPGADKIKAAEHLTLSAEPSQKDKLKTTCGKQPLYFIENRGQVDSQVRYYVRGKGHALFFTDKEVVLTLRKAREKAMWEEGQDLEARSRFEKMPGLAREKPEPPAVVRLTPVGLRESTKPVALDKQDHRVNYFIGNDPKKWHSNIPTYKAVVYREAYPGIDIKFYGQGRHLEYDVVVKPGADPDRVKFTYAGIQGLSVTPKGDLAIHLPDGGMLVQKKPRIYQEIAGRRVPREGKFRVSRDTAQFVYGFEVAAYDRRHPLVIDPEIIYSTYLGGTSTLYEFGNDIAADKEGNAYVTGWTDADDFPTETPIYSYSGGVDAFICKINADGSDLVFSTYLGGSADDRGFAIDVDHLGMVTVAGQTYSDDFPTRDPLLRGSIFRGVCDGFITKLNARGDVIYKSTYLGGENHDQCHAVAVDEGGNTYVAGITVSSDFPTRRSLYPFRGDLPLGEDPVYDAFVTKINWAWSTLLFSTFLGGSGDDWIWDLALDQDRNVYVTGRTNSTDFPTERPLYEDLSGSYDAFVTKIPCDGRCLTYSTYLGGSGFDDGMSIAVDGDGNAYVTGYTSSDNFPTSNPIYDMPVWPHEVFVSKMSADGSDLVYSTYLGGCGSDIGWGIAVNRFGNAYVTGEVGDDYMCEDFPWVDSFLDIWNRYPGSFVARFTRSGTNLSYCTALGRGSAGRGIATDGYGNIYVTGKGGGASFILENPLDSVPEGNSEGFVTKLFDLDVIPMVVAIFPHSQNNVLNLASGTVISVAILGARDIDVRAFDPFSLRLSREKYNPQQSDIPGEITFGITPTSWRYKHLPAPLAKGVQTELRSRKPDPYEDLLLYFQHEDMKKLGLPQMPDGAQVPLYLIGMLKPGFAGTPHGPQYPRIFAQGQDYVTIKNKKYLPIDVNQASKGKN